MAALYKKQRAFAPNHRLDLSLKYYVNSLEKKYLSGNILSKEHKRNSSLVREGST